MLRCRRIIQSLLCAEKFFIKKLNQGLSIQYFVPIRVMSIRNRHGRKLLMTYKEVIIYTISGGNTYGSTAQFTGNEF